MCRKNSGKKNADLYSEHCYLFNKVIFYNFLASFKATVLSNSSSRTEIITKQLIYYQKKKNYWEN